MIGRCARFTEVDGEVQVQPRTDGLRAAPGTMVPVRITGADIYDLTGEIVGATETAFGADDVTDLIARSSTHHHAPGMSTAGSFAAHCRVGSRWIKRRPMVLALHFAALSLPTMLVSGPAGVRTDAGM